MLRRVALVLAILLRGLLAGIPGWIALNRHDLPDPGDADLLQALEVAEEEDGHPELRTAAAALDWPSGNDAYERVVAILRRDVSDPRWLEERVRANAEAFAALLRALAAPLLRTPEYAFESGSDADLGDVLMPIQNLVRLSAAQARFALARGDRKRAIELARPNFAGGTFVGWLSPALTGFDSKRCHIETRIGLVRAVVALRAHEHENAALPERLEDLVPEYLSTIPEDRFDGQPMRYARARRTVWSVGDDFTDDGPPENPSQSEASEPAISLAR